MPLTVGYMTEKVLKNILNIFAAVCIFGAGAFLGNTAELLSGNASLQVVLHTAVEVAAVLVIGVLYCREILKMTPNEIGLNSIRFSPVWIIVSVVLPGIILMFYRFWLPGTVQTGENTEIAENVIYAVCKAGISAGIAEEFVFRGMIFRYMRKTLGTVPAVVIPSAVFAALHLVNLQGADIPDVVQVLVSSSLAAGMFSVIVLLTDSIWPAALVHAVWNILLIGRIFGIGETVNGMRNDSLIRIMPDCTARLLTGGRFGVEAALPAMLGFSSVMIVCSIKYRKTVKPENKSLLEIENGIL